jgi:hypothetical protein
MDEGMETTAPEGATFGTRLLRLDGFHMTAGAAVPVTRDVLEAAITSRPVWLNDDRLRFVDDPRFPEALYAAAIRNGKMQFIARPAGRNQRRRSRGGRDLTWRARISNLTIG